MTCLGTCVPAGPSRKAEPWRWYCKLSEGNCSLTHAISNALFPVPCMTGVLIFFVGHQNVADFSELLVSHTIRRPCSGAACCATTSANPTLAQFFCFEALCSIHIGSTFLMALRLATSDVSAGRGSISEVVPHSCRFGAG